MRPVAVLTSGAAMLGVSLLLAGCGGGSSGEGGPGTTTATVSPGTIEALWRAPGEDVAIVPGTSDYGPGENRVSFLVIDKQGRLVERPTARVWLARGLKQKPFQRTAARLEPIGVPGGAKADAQNIYVAHVKTASPGTYWLLAEPVGGTQVQALGNVVVRKRPSAPDVGDRAIPVDNPTASSAQAAKAITTARPPDTGLLRLSVARALAERKPFVVTFATPLYCQSRTCGPVVQVVQAVAKRWQPKGVEFIHVEIYKDNDPARGVNRWVSAWHLRSEPFTYVVDGRGVIRSKLEGAFSPAELEAAVSKVARS